MPKKTIQFAFRRERHRKTNELPLPDTDNTTSQIPLRSPDLKAIVFHIIDQLTYLTEKACQQFLTIAATKRHLIHDARKTSLVGYGTCSQT